MKEWVPEATQKVQKWIAETTKNVQKWVAEKYVTVKELVKGHIETASKWVVDKVEKVTKLVAGAWKVTQKWVADSYKTVQKTIAGHYEKVKKEAKDFIKSTGNWFSTKWQNLSDITSSTWEEIKKLPSAAYNAVKTKITTLVNDVKDKLPGIMSSVATKMVTDLSKGLIAVGEALEIRTAKGVLGALQAVGGGFQIAAGIALCLTGGGAVLGIPLILHGAADLGQGLGIAINAIAGKEVWPETNFMQEAYKLVGGFIGNAIGGQEGKELGQKIASGVFTGVDIVLGLISVEGGIKILSKLGTMDNIGDIMTTGSKLLTDNMGTITKTIGNAGTATVNALNKLPELFKIASGAISDFGKNIGDTSKLFADIWKQQPADMGVYLSSGLAGEFSKITDKIGTVAKETIKEIKNATKATSKIDSYLDEIVGSTGAINQTKLDEVLALAQKGDLSEDEVVELITDLESKGNSALNDEVLEIKEAVESSMKGEQYTKVNRLKTLKPNISYTTPGGHLYKTDSFGRIDSVEAKLDLVTAKRNQYAQTAAGRTNRLPDDQGGHLIASIFNGSGDLDNLVPMNGNLNQGAWKSMENEWARALTDGKEVKVLIDTIYEGSSLRPSKFLVEYSIDGKTVRKTLDNIAGGGL